MQEINLDKLASLQIVITETETEVSNKDIAIIGMSGTIGPCKDLESFWNCILQGADLIHKYPESRVFDSLKMLRAEERQEEVSFYDAAFLDEVDKFDYEFYGISPKEASLINPHQRLFLENVWATIEDAGYGGGQLEGSNTGVFLGLMSNAGDEYRDYALRQNPAMAGITSVGNMNSITAGRVSYLYDLKGPCMTIDTACSSGLTAIHQACQAIRTGSCDQAIAGSCKLDLAPVDRDSQDIDIDIVSHDGKTRTFDDSADGTGSGEGVCSVLLKSYEEAMKDGDQIYAVIKGMALNQDGSSIGLTAPSKASQEEVLASAWKDADIEPETITYIEAHGTGTKLGDPVEISAISRAFARFTKKSQICAIGSVKTNIGHLNQASGVVGLIKVVLAMKHGMIPPSNHFQRPNRKIHFVDSPVYVNDHLVEWKPDLGLRRAGVSSFGLSGTNVHIVLEEVLTSEHSCIKEKEASYVLLFSAKYEKGIVTLAHDYINLLIQKPEMDLWNLCATAAIGRKHYDHRLAVVFRNQTELRWKLHKILAKRNLKELEEEGVFYGTPGKTKANGLTGLERKVYQLAEQVAQAYILEETQDWMSFFQKKQYRKISLPTYPFQKKRCWVEAIKEKRHPFLDECIADTMNGIIYRTMFSSKRHWVLREHRINGKETVPGVTYMELAVELGRMYFQTDYFQIENVVFWEPLVVDHGEEREVQTVVKKNQHDFSFCVTSRQDGEWKKHAEGSLKESQVKTPGRVDLEGLKAKGSQNAGRFYQYSENQSTYIGPRWNVIQKIEFYEGEALVHLKIPDVYSGDLNWFVMHPSLLDCAMNAMIQKVGEGLYLPWGYKKMNVYARLPKECYSYICRTDHGKEHAEAASFDVTIMDIQGNVLVEAEEYMVKRVHQRDEMLYYQNSWIQKELDSHRNEREDGTVLAFSDGNETSRKVIQRLREEGRTVVEVKTGSQYQKIDAYTYEIVSNEASYRQFLEALKESDLSMVLHMSAMGAKEIETRQQLEESKQTGVMSLYYLTKALFYHQFKKKLDIVLIANQVYQVNGMETQLYPEPAALFGLAKVISQECTRYTCTSIDVDDNVAVDIILKEIQHVSSYAVIAYRAGIRYMQQLEELHLDRCPERNIQFKEDGVYLITGGTGGLGLEFGKYLAKKKKVNLAFLNRSCLPERTQWKEIMEQGTDEKLKKKIKNILKMEETGTNISCYSADVSDEKALGSVLEELRQKYGKINGIIHAAGVAGEGLLMDRKEEDFCQVLKPKMDGTWLINHLTKQDSLDFFVWFSSIVTVTGGVGQGDYTAANSYLDAYAASEGRKGKTVICINWPAWKETGMAADYGVRQEGMFQALSTREALSGFESVLGKNVQNVFITRRKQETAVIKGTIEEIMEKPEEEAQTGMFTAINQNKDEESEIRTRLIAIWKTVLGFEHIETDSNFIDLGGNSVLAVSMYRELEQVFPDMLDISDIYSYPTIEEMTGFLYSQTVAEQVIDTQEDEMDQLLEKLSSGMITEEQLEQLL